jgi:hypothetical protein
MPEPKLHESASETPSTSGKAPKKPKANGSTPNQAPPASVFDDLEALRIADDDGGPKRKEKRLLASVGVKKPGEAQYFRVHDDEDMSWLGYVYTYEKDNSVWYVPRGPAYDELAELTAKLRRVRLFLCLTKRGSVSFWPVSQTDQGSWGSSAREIVEIAKTRWIRVVSNRAEGCYVPFEPEDPLPDPQWPEKPLSELLKLAFRGRVIDRPDHPIIESLKGRGD